MASVSTDKQGHKTIQFKGLDGKRKSIRLGKSKQRTVDNLKTHIEELLEARTRGRSPYDETTAWVSRIHQNAADLYDKLANHGLVPKRSSPQQMTLGPFVDSYIARRAGEKGSDGISKIKPSTLTNFRQTRRCLVTYFKACKPLASITPADAEAWRNWLTHPKGEDGDDMAGQGLGENSARRRCGIARQFFRHAIRQRLITETPFAEMEGGVSVQANRDRDYFITRDEAAKVIDACPDSQWRLLFALSRYGELRCPSEHMGLRWGDVDWERGRMVVRSPKTEHHEGKEARSVPLFPELRPYLQAVYDELLADFDPKLERLSEQPVITRYRERNCNLRTQLNRIIRKAGLKPWPKLFHNLRGTRQTELAEKFPAHVVCEWIGNSQAVAAKHYLQTTDEHFETAASEPTGALHKALQQLYACISAP